MSIAGENNFTPNGTSTAAASSRIFQRESCPEIEILAVKTSERRIPVLSTPLVATNSKGASKNQANLQDKTSNIKQRLYNTTQTTVNNQNGMSTISGSTASTSKNQANLQDEVSNVKNKDNAGAPVATVSDQNRVAASPILISTTGKGLENLQDKASSTNKRPLNTTEMPVNKPNVVLVSSIPISNASTNVNQTNLQDVPFSAPETAMHVEVTPVKNTSHSDQPECIPSSSSGAIDTPTVYNRASPWSKCLSRTPKRLVEDTPTKPTTSKQSSPNASNPKRGVKRLLQVRKL
jgi:hypothetical protein